MASAPPRPRARSGAHGSKSDPHDEPGSTLPVCVVGIGASAGGLEALERLLQHAPTPNGLAFVVVQHLDPDRDALLVELLQHATTMPVEEIVEGATVLPDHVYVMPPNRDVVLRGDHLHLLDPIERRGHRLPIDTFLRSLAEERGSASIGVILSGMGSDGTLGLRAIREVAGGTFVQSLVSAKFEDMPRSAIDADLADVVATAEELAPKIIEHARAFPPRATTVETGDATDDATNGATNGPTNGATNGATNAATNGPANGATNAATNGATNGATTTDDDGIDDILLLIRTQTGHDFSSHKKSSLVRRIERRMGLARIRTQREYARLLGRDPEEVGRLFSELLIGVTSFFRDPAVWASLKTSVITPLVAARGGVPLRAWVPACSTGEEAYSLAILFAEAIEETGSSGTDVQVFGTDLDLTAIDRARAGCYPLGIAADVSEARLERFFMPDEKGYRVTRSLREMVVFAPHDLLGDPPFSRLHVLCCRNLLIYLETAAQQQLMRLFHHGLTAGGTLVLGSAETVGASTDLFSPLPGKTRIFRRLAGPTRPPGVPLPVLPAAFGRPKLNPVGTHARPRKGRAGPAAEGAPPGSGPAEIGGSNPVASAAAGAAASPATRPTDREPTPESTAFARRLARAERETNIAREEMQASMEELGSTNEELQSANEELQSANEELTTSKEEMQSMNEELQTVNQELMAKLDELSRASADMKNLLDSTDIATLFLDRELRVRRFTAQMSKIVKLIPGDVGRPITDLAIDLQTFDLAGDAREVLRTLVFQEREVEASGERWFRVRTMPYRNHDNRIDGLVVTFTDISAAKLLEAQLRRARSLLEKSAATRTNGEQG